MIEPTIIPPVVSPTGSLPEGEARAHLLDMAKQIDARYAALAGTD